MAGRAGAADTLFQHRAHTYGAADPFGSPADQYAAPVNLWGELADVNAGTEEVGGSQTQITRATVRLRNRVSVGPLDTLTDAGTGDVWTVDSAYYDRPADATVCEVNR